MEGQGLLQVGSVPALPFQVFYSAGDYLANLATQSGTYALGEAGAPKSFAERTVVPQLR